jgi:hypothetical protein
VLPSDDGYLLTETCKGIYTYKDILITLDGVIKIILIVLTSVTDQNEYKIILTLFGIRTRDLLV